MKFQKLTVLPYEEALEAHGIKGQHIFVILPQRKFVSLHSMYFILSWNLQTYSGI